jgi:hypothetical protein
MDPGSVWWDWTGWIVAGARAVLGIGAWALVMT